MSMTRFLVNATGTIANERDFNVELASVQAEDQDGSLINHVRQSWLAGGGQRKKHTASGSTYLKNRFLDDYRVCAPHRGG